jgi:hypothetical protein
VRVVTLSTTVLRKYCLESGITTMLVPSLPHLSHHFGFLDCRRLLWLHYEIGCQY